MIEELLNNHFPSEITENIQRHLVCKRINENTKSNNFIILITLKDNVKAHEVQNELLQWIFKCLDTISHRVKKDEYEPYGWSIIHQYYENEFCLAIHLPNGSSFDPLDINRTMTLIRYNPLPPYRLFPQEFLDCFIDEPGFIREIGVNAVSQNVIMDWWEVMIDTESVWFDQRGKGFMKHQMWIKMPDEHWIDIRETSYNFGWGYEWKHRMEKYSL